MLEPIYYIISIVLGLMLIYYLLESHRLKEIIDEKDDPRNIYLSDKEREILKQSLDEYIRLLINAGIKEQDKQKKAK